MHEFKQNGGFCWICDSNHSELISEDGNEICRECAERKKAYALNQQRN